tara:strand:+ start:1151 stop:1816 length:666 start_codon:yes stop_codon:yes gene_type:complete
MWGIAVARAMKPVNQDLILIQDEIRKSFGWDIESDYESAKYLASQCKNPSPSLRFHSKVIVVGAAASPGIEPDFPTIVADGAIGAISDLSNVALIVTDGDGTPHLEKALNKGIPICLHAHGDNQESWSRILSIIDENQEVILTHQTPYEIDRMYNPGGFTDGDRAVCIAFALGATEVELVGFSINDVGQWSGVTDEKRKLIKLKWMNKVLQILSMRVDDEE